jgi:hypothetical protein
MIPTIDRQVVRAHMDLRLAEAEARRRVALARASTVRRRRRTASRALLGRLGPARARLRVWAASAPTTP